MIVIIQLNYIGKAFEIYSSIFDRATVTTRDRNFKGKITLLVVVILN